MPYQVHNEIEAAAASEATLLDPLLTEVERCLVSGQYRAALTLAVTIPDVCVALTCHPDLIWTNSKKYIEWFDNNVAPEMGYLSGRDCYTIRGALLHEGRFDRSNSRFQKVIFSIVEGQDLFVGETLFEDDGTSHLTIALEVFCLRLVYHARQWYIQNRHDVHVASNVARLAAERADASAYGLYVENLPVIG